MSVLNGMFGDDDYIGTEHFDGFGWQFQEIRKQQHRAFDGFERHVRRDGQPRDRNRRKGGSRPRGRTIENRDFSRKIMFFVSFAGATYTSTAATTTTGYPCGDMPKPRF